MADEFVNKVAESGLISLDLEKWYPKEEIVVFDIKDLLFMGMIVKEKEYRESLKNIDWEQYRNKIVAITCSADAIIPMWAYMLIAAKLEPVCKTFVLGNEADTRKQIFLNNINSINVDEYTDQRVIIKGCGETPIGDFAYMEITKKLRPVAKSIMYGEPCSTVPVYKKSI
jgi:hypothetical protein